jgi:hypothetical protein
VARTDAQLAQTDLIDTIRTVVRLKHRIEMRRELNAIEADAIAEYERRLAAGEPFTLDAASLLEG